MAPGGRGKRAGGKEGMFILRIESGGGHGLFNPNKSACPWEVEATGDAMLGEPHTDPRQSSQRNDVLFSRLLERWSAFLLTN